MIIRTKFSKLKPVRYISHLELMNTLRRGFRRAELPVAFSEGFNPHIQLSMGQPLSVGMTGNNEYFDLELTENIDIDSYIQKLNDSLPVGIRIKEAREIPTGIKSLQAIVNTAVYILKMNFSEKIDEDKIIRDFLSLDKIKIVRRRRNKSDREIDLKDMIYDVELLKPGIWKFVVSTGSQGNVRSSEVSRAVANRYSGVEKVPIINIERDGLFVRINDELYEPFAQRVVGS